MDSKQYDCLLIPSDGNLLFRTLKELHNTPRLDRIMIYDAIGSGTVIAIMLYLGMSPSQITTELIHTNIFDCTSHELRTILHTIIGDKLMSMYSTIPTLKELYDLRGNVKVLNLHVYNRTLGHASIINHVTCPDLNCLSACSMAYNLGLTYYEQSYCGNTYIDSSSFVPSYDVLNTHKILCVTTRSSHYDVIRPPTAEEHYWYCFNHLREQLLNNIVHPAFNLIVLYVDNDPLDKSIETKLELLC